MSTSAALPAFAVQVPLGSAVPITPVAQQGSGPSAEQTPQVLTGGPPRVPVSPSPPEGKQQTGIQGSRPARLGPQQPPGNQALLLELEQLSMQARMRSNRLAEELDLRHDNPQQVLFVENFRRRGLDTGCILPTSSLGVHINIFTNTVTLGDGRAVKLDNPVQTLLLQILLIHAQQGQAWSLGAVSSLPTLRFLGLDPVEALKAVAAKLPTGVIAMDGQSVSLNPVMPLQPVASQALPVASGLDSKREPDGKRPADPPAGLHYLPCALKDGQAYVARYIELIQYADAVRSGHEKAQTPLLTAVPGLVVDTQANTVTLTGGAPVQLADPLQTLTLQLLLTHARRRQPLPVAMLQQWHPLAKQGADGLSVLQGVASMFAPGVIGFDNGLVTLNLQPGGPAAPLQTPARRNKRKNTGQDDKGAQTDLVARGKQARREGLTLEQLISYASSSRKLQVNQLSAPMVLRGCEKDVLTLAGPPKGPLIDDLAKLARQRNLVPPSKAMSEDRWLYRVKFADASFRAARGPG